MSAGEPQESLRHLTRRALLAEGWAGVGRMALASLFARDAFGGARDGAPPSPLLPRPPHFAPKAKRIIHFHMAGSPSQLDLFEDKPKLREYNGKPCPEDLFKKERFAFIKGVPKLLGSPYKFARYGTSGQEISELLPHLASIAGDVTFVRSMVTTQFNHAPAQFLLSTGHERIGRPSMGSWLSYGLGSANQDLPAFVVLLSGQYSPDGGAALWSSGFLPTVHQGVRFRSQGDPVLYLSDPPGIDRAARRESIDAILELNRLRHGEMGDPETLTRIEQFEMAYRMQASVPELLDFASEPESVREMYGVKPGKVSFANNALLARRLLERGVRFVQLYHWGWDSHGTGPGDDIVTSLRQRCLETDRPTAALVKDLKQRGLLEDTIVLWSGEFGRTPMNEERNGSRFLGRDHHPHCFTLWLTGGGLRRGFSLGATDELGYHVTEDRVEVHDLHATLLQLLGFDHEKLTYRFQGRDFRLTDVSGHVVSKLLA
ncbi:MAG: DUF1501 domain-containing protein [Planctomycetes bacterium]|nr:DUF1501 domain-containing protein [Planctomycetota bacterium]